MLLQITQYSSLSDPVDCKGGMEALVEAAGQGKVREVQGLVVACPGVRINDESDGQTALWRAASVGHVDVVKFLLSKSRIDVNKVNTDTQKRHTPLFIAASQGYVNVVKELIAYPNIDVNLANYEPTHWPLVDISEGDYIRFNMYDFKISQHDYDGATPLWIASEKGHIEVVNQLLAHQQIKVNQPITSHGAITLIQATDRAIANIRGMVKINVRFNKYNGATPLWIASERGHVEVVKQLLSHQHIKVNQATTSPGPIYLLKASNGAEIDVHGMYDIIINQRTYNGATPLWIASEKGHIEVVKQLLGCIMKNWFQDYF